MKNTKIPVGKGSNAGAENNGKPISTDQADSRPEKSPLFGTDIDVDAQTGKQFELLDSWLFIPLPGEFDSRPTEEAVPMAIPEKGLFVSKSMKTHFQKDFNKIVKLDPFFGEKIKTRDTSDNAARRLLAGVAAIRKKSSY